MKSRILIYYIEGWLIVFPCFLFHESCHYILAIITFYMGYNTFPTMHITRYYKAEYNDSGGMNIYEFSGSVNYQYDASTQDITVISGFTALGPAIGIFLLFVFSPWWMNLLYICNFNRLWLSRGDIDQIKAAAKILF